MQRRTDRPALSRLHAASPPDAVGMIASEAPCSSGYGPYASRVPGGIRVARPRRSGLSRKNGCAGSSHVTGMIHGTSGERRSISTPVVQYGGSRRCRVVKACCQPTRSPTTPSEGQILTGPLFNEPMCVGTVTATGRLAWAARGSNSRGISPKSRYSRTQPGTSSAGSNWRPGRSMRGQARCRVRFNRPMLLPTLYQPNAGIWFTGPLHHAAMPYSDLSDFFLMWLKRATGPPAVAGSLGCWQSAVAQNQQGCSKRNHSCCRATEGPCLVRGNDGACIRGGPSRAREDGVGAVVFAHQTTGGWEALLSGMIRGGWTIKGSWPIATELPSRLRPQDSAALATSIHLICRPHPEDAPVGDWGVVLRELPGRVGDWMERLQEEGMRGADLVFACIGPALEIFSRYARVEATDGCETGPPAYLEKVWGASDAWRWRTSSASRERRPGTGLPGRSKRMCD